MVCGLTWSLDVSKCQQQAEFCCLVNLHCGFFQWIFLRWCWMLYGHRKQNGNVVTSSKAQVVHCWHCESLSMVSKAYRPLPHNFCFNAFKNSTSTRLGWTFSYICCIFIHPDLDLAPLFVGMQVRSIVRSNLRRISIYIHVLSPGWDASPSLTQLQ